MKMLFRLAAAWLAGSVLVASAGVAQVAQEAVDLAVVRQIREEGLERSQVEDLARYLNDVVGPRLTGSPGMRRANEWTAEKFRQWGLANVVIEPWGEFGRGWERVSYSGRVLTPFVQLLHGQPAAWTGSTDGPVRGPAKPLAVQTVEELASYRGTLHGAWVLVREPSEMDPEFEPVERRFDADELLGPVEERQFTAEMRERFRRRRALRRARDEFIQGERVAGIVSPSSSPYGVLRAESNQAGRRMENPIPAPHVIVSAEQYGEIYRNAQSGVPVELEIDVQNRFFTDDLQAYNTLAEIPGGDKAEEYVMIGAHLDSWHMGTGATDNGAGSVVMMEAMRILKTLGLRPRRTIRIALWSGEEQGLLGSRAWVAKHGDLHDRISAYLNVDNGTGRVRGIWDQSNEKAIPIFEQILWPFRDLGVVAVRHGDTGGTDHLSFDAAGIPGFNFIQDPIEYSLRTHHTNVDTFDHLVMEDLEQAAVVVAATAYDLAMRDDIVPRKERTTSQ